MARTLIRAVLLAAIGCASKGPAADDPVRYERGIGVTRDYSRAAQIYAQRCRRGEGDLAACRELVFASLRHRGDERIDGHDVVAWLTRGCELGDWLACAPPYIPFDLERARDACDRGQPGACLAAADADTLSQSGTLEAADRDRRERACRGDVLEACIELVAPGPAQAPADIVERLHHACTAGDADACRAAGTPIAPAELCRAHDYEACGGGADLERACDAGIPDACRDLAVRARDADPPDPKVAARFARACKVQATIDGHDACEENLPTELAIGCAAYLPVHVPLDRRSPLPHLHGTDGRGAAWSAAAGPALLFTARDASPATYAEVARRLAPAVAVYVYAPPNTDPEPYTPAIPIALDPTLASIPVVTGATSTSSPLAVKLGDRWPLVVDGSGVTRAVLSFQHGLAPATLARCVRGLLAAP